MEMDSFLMILFMVVIGATIGAVTNSLAIKMLFRPHKPIYIGKWRVPFTPGLIPKRRDELAVQLGIMVVNHLLTVESIQKKFLNESFQKEMTALVQKELDRLLSSDDTVADFLAQLGLPNSKEILDEKVNSFVEEKYNALMQAYGERPIKAFLSEPFIEKLDSKIPLVSAYILKKGEDFFSSEEGIQKIAVMIDDFAKQRTGMFGNMLQMFLSNVNMTEKIQKEVLKFLKSEGTKDLVTAILRNEWEKILDWEAQTIEEQIGREQILSMIRKYSQKLIRTDLLLNMQICDLFRSFKDKLVRKAAPEGVRLLSVWLSERIGDILQRLRLAEVVREQVESFSVQRIEEMVLLITKREFKMITFLGGFLGGIIGLLQGIIVLFFG